MLSIGVDDLDKRSLFIQQLVFINCMIYLSKASVGLDADNPNLTLG